MDFPTCSSLSAGEYLPLNKNAFLLDTNSKKYICEDEDERLERQEAESFASVE